MRKFLYVILFSSILIIGTWAVFTINLKATSTFSNSKYEKTDIDYEKIKEDTGLDIEKLTKDESFFKIYDTKEGVILLMGKYSLNLNKTYIGRGFLYVIDTIDYGIDCFKNFFTQI